MTIAKQLKKGDKILATDNRRWTVDEVRSLLSGKLELFCHHGMSNQRFIVKPEDPIRVP